MRNTFSLSANISAHWWRSAAACVAVTGALAGTHAQAQAFLLAPTRVVFEGNVRAQELIIMNQSDRQQTYRLRLEDRSIRDSGEYDVVPEASQATAATPMVRLSAKQFVVPPRESATLRVLLRKPAGLTDGEYRSHIVVTELPVVDAPTIESAPREGIDIRITPVFSISIPVIVRVGATSAKVSVGDVKRLTAPGTPNLDVISLTLSNVGNRTAFVDVSLVSTRDRRSKPIASARAIAVYYPINRRVFNLPLTEEQTALARAGGVVLRYQEVDKDGNLIGAPAEVAV